MKNENVVCCPPCGESTAKRGKGVVNKEILMDNPPSALRATSPAGGEVNGGFTLIELLVVVLIIGILAAVAVPQYQKAVWKARFSEGAIIRDSLKKAAQVYALNHIPLGPYLDITENLDIDVERSTDYWTFGVYETEGCFELQGNFYADKEHNYQLLSVGECADLSGGYCYYVPDSKVAKQLCEQTEQLWGYDDIDEG